MYSFGFNGFICNIKNIQNNLHRKHISLAKFGKKTKFVKAYYPKFKNLKHVKNNM